MDISFLSEYFVPTIVGICLCVGFVLKSATPMPNKYIPAVNGVLGLALAGWIHWPAITPEVILAGLFSGLASTGLYEAFRQLIDRNKPDGGMPIGGDGQAQRLILPINSCAFSAGYKNAAYRAQQGYTHYGVDLYSLDGDTSVRAIGDGIVMTAGADGATDHDRLGNCCVVVYRNVELHDGSVKDLACRMFHFASLAVRQGQILKKGDLIGQYGNTGGTLVNGQRMGKHLHIEFDTDVQYPAYAVGIKFSGKVIKKGSVDSTIDPSSVWFLSNGQSVRGIYTGWYKQEDIALPAEKAEELAAAETTPIAWDEDTYTCYYGEPVWAATTKDEDGGRITRLYDRWWRKVPSDTAPGAGEYATQADIAAAVAFDGEGWYGTPTDSLGKAGIAEDTQAEQETPQTDDPLAEYTDAQLGAALRKALKSL